MSSSLAAAALAVLATGFVAGRRYERAIRGWTDYKARKAEIPVLRAAARLLSAQAAGAALAASGVTAWSLWVLLSEGS